MNGGEDLSNEVTEGLSNRLDSIKLGNGGEKLQKSECESVDDKVSSAPEITGTDVGISSDLKSSVGVSGGPGSSADNTGTAKVSLAASSGDMRTTSNQVSHRFWDTQPVPGIGSYEDGESMCAALGGPTDDTSHVGPIDAPKTPADVRLDPLPLPKGFGWVTLDLEDSEQLKSLYTLLTENYVEDDENMFRFDYSPEFLLWALHPPGFIPDWIVGVEALESKRLLAAITGIPVTTSVMGKSIKMAEINFLCVHKKLRSKRLAPVLIKEITRRVNLTDQWQAIYTAGIKVPEPIGVSRYFHRSLNPKKLIEVGFSSMPRLLTMTGVKRLYAVPEQPSLRFVRMEARHASGVQKLLSNYLKNFKVHIEMDTDEVAHWFLPRPDVVYSYVIEDPADSNKVTDLCSFYDLSSSIIGNSKHKRLRAAYSYYNVATTTSLKQLMADSLVFAKQNDFDVFNALDVMENESVFSDLKFGEGDGFLHYYFYNYMIGKSLKSKEIAVVLL